MPEEKVGVVTHYYGHLLVAAVQLTDGPLRVGDKVHFHGHTSDFYQTVDSMQIEHQEIQQADVGDEVGMRVTQHARQHDTVYRVTETQ